MPIRNLLLFLNAYFNVDRYSVHEQGGIYCPSDRPVQRLGLALDPDPWLIDRQPDALWLHRPWKLDAQAVPSDMGVIYHHLPFDETLTMGFNQPLAILLGLAVPEELGYKQAFEHDNRPLPRRAIGMIGNVPIQSFADWQLQIRRIFGGYEQAFTGQQTKISRVAVVGAMTKALIWEAADRGASLYLTGQYRSAAQEAVDETGISVIATGHRRTEEWGLQALADILHVQFPDLDVLWRRV